MSSNSKKFGKKSKMSKKSFFLHGYTQNEIGRRCDEVGLMKLNNIKNLKTHHKYLYKNAINTKLRNKFLTDVLRLAFTSKTICF